ncbi:hypothetical protein Dimus_033816, partial [Dionaea muscipula]
MNITLPWTASLPLSHSGYSGLLLTLGLWMVLTKHPTLLYSEKWPYWELKASLSCLCTASGMCFSEEAEDYAGAVASGLICGDGMWTIPSASVPSSIMETHELSGMTLEYRRECGRDNVVAITCQ